ncbi:MAG: HIRAN domain-containing protein [Clostridiales bacterium]|nr:HIRAN domain-containing protein [Clostridiales bacterium]
MKKVYFTITGCNHYFGNEFMKKGMKVKLVKEPDNEFDKEAIQVEVKGLGKCGYVANSPHTVKGKSLSAGRLYDQLGKKAKGKIVHVIPGGAICRVTN